VLHIDKYGIALPPPMDIVASTLSMVASIHGNTVFDGRTKRTNKMEWKKRVMNGLYR
jgi:hypothetical protein